MAGDPVVEPDALLDLGPLLFRQAIAWPGEACQCGIDTGIAQPSRWPAVDVPMGQPVHEKRYDAASRRVGEQVPAERHPEQAGDDAENRRTDVGQRLPLVR